MNELGKRISNECERLKISVPNLAKMAGVSYTTLKDNMNKKEPNPNLKLIKRVSISLGVTTDYLIFGEDIKKDDEIGVILKEIKTLKKEDKQRILYMLRMMIADSKRIA